MKTVSRNKFLLCFRPVVDMDLVIEAEGGIDRSRRNQSFKYISESGQKCLKDSANSSMIVRQPSNRTLSKAKGVRDRKSLSQETYQSKRSFSRKKSLDDKSSELSNSSDDSTDHHRLQDQTSKSSPPALLSSQSSLGSSSSLSSCTSTISLEPKGQNQNKKDQKKHVGSSNSSFNFAIGLLLLSLTVTILWGKVCAILFTSIWLYFIPQQQSGWRSEDEKKLNRRSESRDHYKKRMIMEGLLERSHRREVALNF